MRHFTLIAGITLLSGPALAQLLSLPQNTLLTQPATSNTTWRHAAFRSQTIFDSTHLTAQGVVGSVSIDRLRFRAANGNTGAGGQYTGVNVTIGTAAVDYLAMNNQFSVNIGTQLPVVVNGTVTVLAGAGTTPNNYVIDIPIPGGFPYDPTLGQDLFIDISATGVVGTPPVLVAASSPAIGLCRGIHNVPDTALTGVFTNSPAMVLIDISGGPGGVPNITPASATSVGTGCYDFSRSFAETFPGSGGTVDLASGGFTMLPDVPGAPTSYVVLPQTNPVFFQHGATRLLTNATTPAAMSDDSLSQPCALPFTFPFVGGSTSVVHADSNGYVILQPMTGTGGDTTSSLTDLVGTTTGTHAGTPRLCPLWYDLHPTRNSTTNPNAGLYFDVDTLTNKAYLTWDDFGEFATSTAGTKHYTFQVEFSADGTIEVRYGLLSAFASTTGVLVGFSPGTGSRIPTPIDISASIPFATNVVDRTPLTSTMPAPVIGTTVTGDTVGIPVSPGGFFHFISATQLPGIDLAVLGAAGCRAYMDPGAAISQSLHIGAPTLQFGLPIPFLGSLIGATVFAQATAFDPLANTFGVVTSNGVTMVIGL